MGSASPLPPGAAPSPMHPSSPMYPSSPAPSGAPSRPDPMANIPMTEQEVSTFEVKVGQFDALLRSLDLSTTDPRRDPTVQSLLTHVTGYNTRVAATMEAESGGDAELNMTLIGRLLQTQDEMGGLLVILRVEKLA